MNKKIIDTLKSLGLPVNAIEYSGDAPCYIIFSIFNEYEGSFSDDKEGSTTYDISLNIWFNDVNYFDKYKEVKTLMKQAGFTFLDAMDIPKDEGYYGKNLTFSFREVA